MKIFDITGMRSLFILSGLLLCNSLFADRFYVDASAGSGGDGISWATAFRYLQDALDQTEAQRGDEVWIADGVYYPDLGASVSAGDRAASFYVKNGVILYGGFSGDEASVEDRDWINHRSILSGEIFSDPNSWSTNVCHAINAIFDGIEVIRGSGETGVAVVVTGTITTRNCLFAEHRGRIGVVGYDADWTATNCNFSSNTATLYGAVASRGDWTVTDCVFRDNHADRSGGVAYESDWIASDCLFEGNSAEYSGGVVYFEERGRVWRANDCTFSGNYGGTGGVAASQAVTGIFYATGCSFSSNYALEQGGVGSDGIWHVEDSHFSNNRSETTTNFRGGGVAYSGEWAVNNSDFVGNSASSGFGGVANEGVWNTKNCQFTGNSALYGGVAYNPRDWQIVNGLFSDNTASTSGGVAYGGSLSLINCVVLGNQATSGGVTHDVDWQAIHSTFVENSATFGSVARKGQLVSQHSIFTGVGLFLELGSNFSNRLASNQPRAVNLILGGEGSLEAGADVGEGFILSEDPLFVDADDPIGPDGVWGTEDDGLQLTEESPAVAAGDSDLLPPDTLDIDGDEDVEEPLPLDFAFADRVQREIPDLGAYESSFGDIPDPEIYYTVEVTAGTGGIVSPEISGEYLEGTEIEVTATSSHSVVFTHWSGSFNSTANPLTFSVNSDTTLVANFGEPSLNVGLFVGSSSGGSTTPTGSSFHAPGASVQVTAIPSEGYVFLSWSGDVSSEENPLMLTLDDDTAVFANFYLNAEEHTLTVSEASGGVTDPVGSGVYSQGTMVEVTATPDAGYVFDSWSGDVISSDNPLQLTMNSDLSITPVWGEDDSDSDSDMLSNYEEVVVYGTNPEKADSNGDGIDDGVAVESGLNPAEDYSALLGYIVANPDEFSLCDESAIFDLRYGELFLWPNVDGTSEVSWIIESSTDMESWQEEDEAVYEITVPQDKVFIRIRPER